MSSHIDQAISGLKKAEEQYIKYGLTTIPEITSEFLNLCSTDTAEGLEEYRVLMKEYVEMDHDSKLFIRTLDQVKRLVTALNSRNTVQDWFAISFIKVDNF